MDGLDVPVLYILLVEMFMQFFLHGFDGVSALVYFELI